MIGTKLESDWKQQLRHALWEALRSRRDRRAWIVCMYLGLGGGTGAAICLRTVQGRASLLFGFSLVFALLALVAWQVLAWWARPWRQLNGSTDGAYSLRGATTDVPLSAGEKAKRDRSYRCAYHVVVLGALAASVATYIYQEEVPNLFRALADRDLLLITMGALILFLASLPAAFHAWSEPDGAVEADSIGSQGR